MPEFSIDAQPDETVPDYLSGGEDDLWVDMLLKVSCAVQITFAPSQ